MPGSTTTSGGGVAKVTRTATCCACAGASGTHTSPTIIASRKFLMLAVSRGSRSDSTGRDLVWLPRSPVPWWRVMESGPERDGAGAFAESADTRLIGADEGTGHALERVTASSGTLPHSAAATRALRNEERARARGFSRVIA